MFSAFARTESRPTSISTAAEPAAPRATVVPQGADADDLVSMKRRLAVLEAANEVSVRAASSIAIPTATAPAERPPLEEARIAREQFHDALIQSHLRQAPDPKWAGGARAKMATDLSTAAQGRFHATDVDCRMTTCTAKIQWDSFDQAATSFNSVLNADLGMQCRRDVLLKEPEDRTKPYEAVAFFDCEEDRTDRQ